MFRKTEPLMKRPLTLEERVEKLEKQVELLSRATKRHDERIKPLETDEA